MSQMQIQSRVFLGWLVFPVLIVGLFVEGAFSQSPIQFPVGKPDMLQSETGTVRSKKGAKKEAEIGTLLVPESRAKPSQRVIEIPFYRFKSTAENPASPIFLLAGGPGSSWIDLVEREENLRKLSFTGE